MALNTKAIKNRIKSVKNAKKITKAMEMISAVKMRKSVQSAQNSRSYAKLAVELIDRLGEDNINHLLMQGNQSKKRLLVVITSNRGLCGGYNSKVLKQAVALIESVQNPSEIFEILAIGKKSAALAKRYNLPLVALYEKFSENPDYNEIVSVARTVRESFEKKIFSEVTVIFTEYISGLTQKVETRRILPISPKQFETDSESEPDAEVELDEESDEKEDGTYMFEPGKKRVLAYILPILIEIQLFQAIQESAASEHSSRMIAMKNAHDNASDLIDELNLEFNKQRQSAITQEISEIIGGANA